MRISSRNPPLSRILLLTAGLVAASAWACSVPVFRYALEHWEPDRFRAMVLNRGPLPEAAETLLRRLGPATGMEGAAVNLDVERVDLGRDPSPEVLALWKEAGSPAEPWLLLLPPRPAPPLRPLFSGALNEAAVAAVLDSPARAELSRRIGEGESAVWVLLESGDPARDAAAAGLLEARLAYLAGVMQLPKLDEQDIKNGLVSLPGEGLRLAFSVLRVSRRDPAERVFLSLLLNSERDLREQTEPMVFPVFGRGRVLYALVGPGIRHETIDEAASFLIGSCSCQVKEENPGSDLLTSTDWPKLIKAQAVGVQDLPEVKDIVGGMPAAVTISPQPAAGVESSSSCCALSDWVKRHPLPSAALALGGLGALGWLLLRRMTARSAAKEP